MLLPENKTLRSGPVILRNIQTSDATPHYQKWLEDPLVSKYLVSGTKKYSHAELVEYIQGCIDSSNTLLLAIEFSLTSQHVGNIKLGPIDFRHRFATLGIAIGERSVWGKGIATQAIQLLSDYAFTQLDLRKILAGVLVGNEASKKAFEKSGYQCYAVRKEQFLLENTPVDEYLLERFYYNCNTDQDGKSDRI